MYYGANFSSLVHFVNPKLKKFLKMNASSYQNYFSDNQTKVDAKLNVYNFEKLHLQAYA